MLVFAAAIAAACKPDQGNFSQDPGFTAYFATRPRGSDPPSEADKRLLAAHAPRILLPAGHPGLIGFYPDYIAQGMLTDGAGRVISTAVDREILNAHKADPLAIFVHRPRAAPQHPIVFARIDREPGPSGAPWTFLTYNAVFRHSGVPAGMPRWQDWALGLIADLEDWHQLDHYTAATIAFDEAGHPVALILQQHNDLRTYLFGRDVPWPDDGRVVLDVAMRSNELYPHEPGPVRHRAVAMPSAAGMRYLVTGRGRPLFAADDITDSVDEAAYRLGFLPHDDAFYAFQGWLGERRLLPGRDGPPGADFNTWPHDKGKLREMLAGYWREGDERYLAALAKRATSGDAMAVDLEGALIADLRCLASGPAATC
ncbi:MAG: hypothetical protein U1F33_09635 [Alphaproteobacteria bacterium]